MNIFVTHNSVSTKSLQIWKRVTKWVGLWYFEIFKVQTRLQTKTNHSPLNRLTVMIWITDPFLMHPLLQQQNNNNNQHHLWKSKQNLSWWVPWSLQVKEKWYSAKTLYNMHIYSAKTLRFDMFLRHDSFSRFWACMSLLWNFDHRWRWCRTHFIFRGLLVIMHSRLLQIGCI